MTRQREDDEWEEEQPYLERGEAYAISDHVNVIDYSCPMCGRHLFKATQGSDAVIFIRCHRCRDEVAVDVRTRRKIGF